MLKLFRYSILPIITSLIAFAIHLVTLNYMGLGLLDNMIIIAYGSNTVLAILIVVVLLKLPKSLQSSLGFLFLFGSMLKFILFFALFFPVYRADGDISKQEFFTFFIPYAVALFSETLTLTRVLSRRTH